MILSNAILCDMHTQRRCDIKIEEGIVVAIEDHIEGDDRMECHGAYLMPGLVDANVCPRDGQINGASLERLAKKALRGGITTAVLLPETTPSIENEIVLEFVQKARHNDEGATLEASVASICADGGMSNLAILLKRGAVAPYVRSTAKNNLFCRIAEYAKMYDVTLFVRAEDESLAVDGVMHEGEMATKLGLVGISPLSETLHVSRFIELARFYGIRIVFKCIAQPRSLELISAAKQEGINVEAEVSIHHLLYADEACEDFNTDAKIDPPLLPHSSMLQLQEALKNGRIDMLSTLHQPFSAANKEVAFADACYGTEAIGEAISLYYTYLVKSGWIDMSQLIRMACYNPARSINKQAGTITVGTSCDMILFDPDISWTVENPHSLFAGEKLEGKVIKAIFSDAVVAL